MNLGAPVFGVGMEVGMSRTVHFEILADDPQKLVEFYKQVLGWEISTWDGPQTYWLAKTGEADCMGIDGGFMRRELLQPVINTTAVEGLEQTLAKVLAAGGRIERGPYDIPGIGRHAYCSDPEGILFGLLQPLMPAR